MTIDWPAEARRVASGRRFGKDMPPPMRDASPTSPLSEADLREAEQQLGITLPEEYRTYLLGNPAGGTVRQLYRSSAGWGWHGDSTTNYSLLSTPFPHPDSYRAYDDELGGREPLESDFPDGNAYREAWTIWDAECEVLEEHKTSGAAFIQDNGCGFSTVLVLTGLYRGTMWFDARATCEQILPMNLNGQPISFADWLGRNSMDLLGW